MELLVGLGLIMLGFLLGYFFKTAVLLIISVIFIGIGVVFLKKSREIETLIAMIFMACVVISSLAMWITWYFVNDKTFVRDFLNQYIFR